MKNNIFTVVFFLFTALIGNKSIAQIIPLEFVKKNCGYAMSAYNTALDTVVDDKYTDLVNPLSTWPNQYKHGKVNNLIKLYVKDTNLASTAFSYNFLIKVTTFSRTGAQADFNITIPLSYNPEQYKPYRDVSTYKFSNAHKFTCNIISVTDAATGANVTFGSLKKKFELQQIIQLERYFKSSYDEGIDTLAIQHSTAIPGKIKISWDSLSVSSPTVFELEWMHINNYGAGYTEFLKDYTFLHQDFNSATGVNAGWVNAITIPPSSTNWGIADGSLYFNKGASLNYTVIGTIPGRHYKLVAKLKEITPGETIDLIVFNPGNTAVSLTTGALLVENDFVAVNDTTPIAILNADTTVMCKIDDIYLIDITFEPAEDEPYFKPAEKLEYSFKNNATRVRIEGSSYTIENVYEQGYLLYRLRRVRPDSVYFTYEKFGQWSPPCADEGLVSTFTKAIPIFAHQGDSLNWNYSVNFIEGGKHKDIVGYYDGLFKPRQQVAISNAEKLVIVGETKYDYNGRPAVEIIPSPSLKSGTIVNGQYYNDQLKYYTKFNVNQQGKPYSWTDFDSLPDICPADTAYSLAAINGASKYFSTSNSDKNGMQKFVPDAENYPMVHVEYMPDNTDRIRRKGSVGATHQLGKGHETFYYYSQPRQQELDRLFGSEAGYGKHYKKQTVIDANGQVSVSYTDMEGRTVATGLAEQSPENLDALPENRPNSLMFNSLNENNLKEDNALTITYEHTLSKSGPLYIDYRMQTSPYRDACLPMDFCFKCVYNYEITLINKECNQVVFTFKDTIGFINPADTLCDVLSTVNLADKRGVLSAINANIDTTYYDSLIRINSLDRGTYSLTKKLTINKGAFDMFVNQYLTKQECVKTFSYFFNEALSKIDTSVCADCETCDNDSIGYCDALLEQLKADVAPGGQYCSYEEVDGEFIPTDSNVSVLKSTRYSTIHGYTFAGKIDKIRLADGTIDSVYKADVTTFVNAFKSSWQDSLVQFHPEYVYYRYCRDSLTESYAYDFKRQAIEEYDTALLYGYLNPTGLTGLKMNYPADAEGLDPYFEARPVLKAHLNRILTRYKVINDTVYSAWDMAVLMGICSQRNDPQERYACLQSFSNRGVLDSLFYNRRLRNRFLAAFNGFYASAKSIVLDSMLLHVPAKYNALGHSYPTCLVGTAGCGDYANKIRRYYFAPITGITGSSDAETRSIVEDSVEAGFDNEATCIIAAEQWMKQLTNCEGLNLNRADSNRSLYDSIMNGFIELCQMGKNYQNPPSFYPATEVPLTVSDARFYTLEDVLETFMGPNYKNKFCNVNLLTNAFPLNHQFDEKDPQSCKCVKSATITPPVVNVTPEVKTKYSSACVKSTMVLTEFGKGLLAFFNEMRDAGSGVLTNGSFIDTGYNSVKTYWANYNNPVLVRTEIVERNYPGALAGRSRTEWKINFLDTTDKLKRCNIFINLTDTPNISPDLALEKVYANGFLRLLPITKDSFKVDIKYEYPGHHVPFHYTTLVGVSGCYNVFTDSCTEFDYDTLYGSPAAIDSTLLDSFMDVARTIRKGETDLVMVDYFGSGGCESTLGTGGFGGCKISPSLLSQKLVESLSEALYIGRITSSNLDSLPTLNTSLFTALADAHGHYNHSMCELSPTYGDVFSLEWSRYDGYRGFKFSPSNDVDPVDCYDDRNVYRDPEFIGLSQFGIGGGDGPLYINCDVSFGDPYHTGIEFNQIDSFANFRFDSVIGAWAVDAMVLYNDGRAPLIGTLRVITCKDEPVCPALAINNIDSAASFRRNGFTPTQQLYAFECVELNRYYEQNHDRTCNTLDYLNMDNLRGFTPFFFQSMLNKQAQRVTSGTKHLVSTNPYMFDTVGMPAIMGSIMDTFDYQADHVSDSLLIAYLGNHNSLAKGCQLSLRLLDGDSVLAFSAIDSFYGIRADDEKLLEYLELGDFDRGKHYFIINAVDTNNTDKTYELRGWVSCMPVYSCAVIREPAPLRAVTNDCGCATCPEFAAVVDSFFNTHPDVRINDLGYASMLTNFVNKQLDNNLTYTEVDWFLDQCRLTQSIEMPKIMSDLVFYMGSSNPLVTLPIDGVIKRINEKYGHSIRYEKYLTDDDMFIISVFLDEMNHQDRTFYTQYLHDSLFGIDELDSIVLSPAHDYTIALKIKPGCANQMEFTGNMTDALDELFEIDLPLGQNRFFYEANENNDPLYTGLYHIINLDTHSLEFKQRLFYVMDSIAQQCSCATVLTSFSTYNPELDFLEDTVELVQTDTNYLTIQSKNTVTTCDEVYSKILKFQDYMYAYKEEFVREALLPENLSSHLFNWYGYNTQIYTTASEANTTATDLLVCSPTQQGHDFLSILRHAKKEGYLLNDTLNLSDFNHLRTNSFIDTLSAESAYYYANTVYTNFDTVTVGISIWQDNQSYYATIHADSFIYLADTLFTIEKSFTPNTYWLVVGARGHIYRYLLTVKNITPINCCGFPKPALCFKPQSQVQMDNENNCLSDLLALAESNALNSYEQYKDSLVAVIKNRYYNACLDSAAGKEKIAIGAGFAEYHYTLYYYDLAGNLIKTVPPAGVDTLNLTSAVRLNLALNRNSYNSGTHVYTNHKLVTNYQYNSLGQVRWQKTPDGGESHNYYDMLGRLVLSQSSKQAAMGNVYSYTVRDALNRITEVGEISSTAVHEDSLKFNYNIYYTAWLARGHKTQITKTFYDVVYSSTVNSLFAGGQLYLRNRVSTVAYFDYDVASYTYATHYSYDIHGNVAVLVQDYPELQGMGNRYKYLHYDYDLISGKVNMVSYQPNQPDRFYHRYSYDEDNRLTNVYTSSDSIIWNNDATYSYYRHGPLARLSIGEQNVQGVDYAYTIHGWLKGVNSATLDSTRDMGNDGYTNTSFASDVFGFTLGYYQGDYKPIDNNYYNTAIAFVANTAGSPLAQNGLYNGNISHMVQAVRPLMAANKPMANLFSYDQLNRITAMATYSDVDMGDNAWESGTAGAEYLSTFGYDPNGNIKNLFRNGLSSVMDSLGYNYYPGTNRLRHVSDNVSAGAYPDDIDNQSSNNYQYDPTGNLAKDVAEQIDTIQWNVYGKIRHIKRDSASTKPGLEFKYDAAGQRVAKIIKQGKSENTWAKQYYVRDAQGNIMATYNSKSYVANDALNIAAVTEWVTDSLGTDSLIRLIQVNFASNTELINLLITRLVDNNTAGEVLSNYTLAQVLAWDNELAYEIVGQMSSASQSNQQGFLSELITYDKTAFMTALAACGTGNQADMLAALFTDNDILQNTIYQLCENGYTAEFEAMCSLFSIPTEICDPDPPYTCVPKGCIGMAMDLVAYGDRGQLISEMINNIGFTTIMLAIGSANTAADIYATLDPATSSYNVNLLLSHIQGCMSSSVLAGFYSSSYSNTSFAFNLLLNNADNSYMLSLAADNTLEDFFAYGIITDVNALNEALALLTGFDVTQYMNMVKVRWGQQAYESLAKNLIYTQQIKLAEHHLYGSSRLGIKYADTTLYLRNISINGFDSLGNIIVDDVLDSTKLQIDTAKYYHTLALKQFELTAHNGNVLATVLDRRTPHGTSTVDYYTADVVNANYYYPYHSTMKEWSAPDTTEYRFGATNGQEKDNEIRKDMYGAEFWEYDARLGHRWNRDPVPDPSLSDYSVFGSNPILNVDPDGAYFFGLFGSTSEQRRTARDFAAATGGTIKSITSKNISVEWWTKSGKRNEQGEVEITEQKHTMAFQRGGGLDYGDALTNMMMRGAYESNLAFGDYNIYTGYPKGSGAVTSPTIDPIDILVGGLAGGSAALARASLPVSAVKGGIKTIDDLFAAGTKMPNVKAGGQISVKGNIDDIFNSLSKGGKQINPAQVKLPDGTLITKYPAKSGSPTLQINQKEKITKVRIE